MAYGLGFIINEELIQKAYNIVKATNPESICFVDSARLMLKACKITIDTETPNWELYEAGLACSFTTYNEGDKNYNVVYLMRDQPFGKYGILHKGYPEKIRTPNFKKFYYSYPKDEFLQIMSEHLNIV